LLLQGGPGWERYVDRCRQPFEASSGVEVLCVVPEDVGTVSREALGVIDGAGGIFMGGGDPSAYHAAFVASPAGDVAAMQLSGAGLGLGLDEPVGLHIDGPSGRVLGRGTAYVLRRKASMIDLGVQDATAVFEVRAAR
jgi:cyanophycinase-like exopeptidase